MLTFTHSEDQPALLSLPMREEQVSQFEMVGEGAAMKRLRLQISRLGPHFRTVFIRGEVGTGKELAARALHHSSPGASGPFVICVAGDLEEWADSKIYEHIQTAERGTLFLDCIEEMPLRSQARLAKALEQKSCTRVIASSSQDLRILTSSGRFRHDLYNRVATVEMALEPLRDRLEDLAILAMHFVIRFAKLHGKRVATLPEETLNQLRKHNWPGNIRELENVMWNVVMRSENRTLEVKDLISTDPDQTGLTASMSGCRSMRLQDVMEQHMLLVLERCGGNKLRAAELLGISRSTLYRMIDSKGHSLHAVHW